MSAQQVREENPANAHRDEMRSALFAHLIMQQSNMAMMLMGKVAHPDTGQTSRDMEAAKLFIDLLEMLEEKTKGNLSKEEASLLKQTLMTLRLQFVEAVESSPAPPAETPEQKPRQNDGAGERHETKTETGSASTDEDEHRKKFSKKY